MKQYYLSYRPRTECSISQFFETNCTQSIFRTINHGLLAKTFTVKKFPKSPIRPAGSHIWRAPNLQWTLIKFLFNIIKNLLRLFIFFYLMVLYLEKHLIRPAFWILLHAMSMNDCKQTAQRFKLQERLLTINKRNIIRWNIYRDNNFHSRRQVLKVLIKLQGQVYVLSRPPGVCFFQRWTRGKKIAQSFLSTDIFITKYSLERFLSVCGEKIYLKAF